MSGDQLNLDAIEALRLVAYDDEARTWHERQDATWALLGDDGLVPALIAEVRRLRAEIDRREAADEFREGCERFDLTFGDDDAGVRP